MNKIILSGNIGKSPELTFTKSGDARVTFTLAVNEYHTSRTTGERVTRTTWFNLVIWGPYGETLHKLARKGTKILIDGRMQANIYEDATGNKRTAWEVVVNTFDILSPKPQTEDAPPVFEEEVELEAALN